MEKLNVTKGEWHVEEIGNHISSFYKVFGGSTSICNVTTRNYDNASYNAQLIADAGTTYNKCEKLPSELLAEHKELMEFIKRISIYDTTVKNMFDVKKEAKQLINKQTK